MDFDLGLNEIEEVKNTGIDEFDIMFLMSILVSAFLFLYIYLYLS